MTRSTFTPDAERQRRTPDMGTVVCVSATHSKQNGNSPCITAVKVVPLMQWTPLKLKLALTGSLSLGFACQLHAQVSRCPRQHVVAATPWWLLSAPTLCEGSSEAQQGGFTRLRP